MPAASGAAFFALETHYGPQMLSELMASTRPVAAFAQPATRQKLTTALVAARSPPLLTLDGAAWKAEAAAALAPPRESWPRAAPFDTGIITMTSGTSGKPKAIACPVSALS